MATGRREFIGRVAVGTVALTGMSAIPTHVASALGIAPTGSSPDIGWMKRVTGRHRAVFDCAEVESAYGVWRSTIWGNQMQEAFEAKPTDISTVLVLRHNAIVLAMQQPYWDSYAIGRAHNATHPLTLQSTERNPALLSSTRGEIDAQFDAMALDKAIARGTIVLGCSLAFEMDVVPAIVKKDGVSADVARQKARSLLVPGVIMQPSGVFASLVAQDAGCHYIRAS